MIGIIGSGIDAIVVARALSALDANAGITCCIDNLRIPLFERIPQKRHAVLKEMAYRLADRGADCLLVASHQLCGFNTTEFRQGLKARGIACFDILSETVAACRRTASARRIGVMAPRATVESGIYRDALSGYSSSAEVIERPSPLWISFIQEGIADRPEIRRNIKKALRLLLVRQIDTLVLGCAAYSVISPFLKKKAGKNVRLIDSTTELVQAVIKSGFCEKANVWEPAERQGLNILATRIDTDFEHACGILLKGLPGYPPAKCPPIVPLRVKVPLSEI